MRPFNSLPITDVKLGNAKLYSNGIGDTWDPAWAEDDSLYSPGNDGSGWDKSCASNVFFNITSGVDPLHLIGRTVNGMPEYDGWAKEGPDGCTWKSSGCIAVDGSLYFVVARHKYGTKSGDPHQRQTVSRASIIKSSDYGENWVRLASDNYNVPMFPSQRFSTPYFIHYGQNGNAPDVDRANEFVYAISNNGFWCNGDNYILGRVERTKLSRLDGSDWYFYLGGDGSLDRSWSKDMDLATLIIDRPLQCGETGVTYIPSIGRYILVAWYYPGDPNVETDETRLLFYEAPKPWGPWTFVKEEISNPEGWYCPRILSKWQQKSGNEVDAILVAGGDYYEMDQYYRFTVVPLKIKIAGLYPEPTSQTKILVVDDCDIGDGLGRFQYQGSWRYSPTREKALDGGEHYSVQAGDSFTISFQGTRLKWYSSKENNMGIAAISIDGGEERFIDLYTYCHVPQYGRLVYVSDLLKSGTHTFKVRVSGQKNDKSRDYFVNNDWVEITLS
jgi:hypothetical protein